MPVGDLIAEIGSRAIHEFVGTLVEPPARWLGYHLAKYVFLLGQCEVRRDGWVVLVDRERVLRDAAAALRCEDVDAFLHEMGRSIGPPWQAKHKLAAAAAIAATEHPAARAAGKRRA